MQVRSLTMVAAMFAALALVVPARECVCAEEAASRPAPPDYDDYTGLSIEDLMDIEIDEVYGASKYRQKLSDAPASVSIITKEEIKTHGYRNLGDILAATRSFYTTYDRLYQFAGVRGLLLAGDYNSRILVMIDGHRTNDPVYILSSIGNELPLDVDLIERVEIVRGPSMSIYGSNALFAVVNIITRAGSDVGAELSAEAGSHDAYKARASYGTGGRNGFDLLLSGTYFDKEGNTDLYYKEYDAPETNGGHARYMDDEYSFNFFGRASYLGFTLEGAHGKREKTDPTGSYGTIFNNPRTRVVDSQSFVELRYAHPVAPLQGEVSAKAYYDRYVYDGDFYYDFNMGFPPPLLVVNKDYGRGEEWGAELQLTATLFDRHKLLAGGSFRDRFHLEQGNYDEGLFSYLLDVRHLTDWGLYVQDDFSVFDNLILSAGVGYNHYETFGSTTNPRVAVIYKPFDETSLKLLYATGFRSPSALELYYHDGYETAKPNPYIKEETIHAYEMVMEQGLGPNIKGTATAFYYDIEDLISKSADPADGLEFYDNTSDVDARGVEVELSGRWESGLEGRISYSYQRTENEKTGKQLPNSPKHLAKLNLTVPLWRDRLFAGFDGRYIGKRQTFKNSYAEDYFTANLTLLGRGFIDGLEVSASVYNLFNDKHGDPADDAFMQNTIQQDGTTFRFKVTYRY